MPDLAYAWEGRTLEHDELSPPLVQRRLEHLKTFTSPGPDGFPSSALRELAAAISLPACSLFQKSLDSDFLLDGWTLGTNRV